MAPDAEIAPPPHDIGIQGRWLKRAIGGGVALTLLIGAYALAGFYLVPHLIRSQATGWVHDRLGKTLSLGDIRFNPFRFTLEIGDIAIAGPEHPMVAIGRLHLDFSVRSLVQHAYRFDEVRIERPFVHAVIRPNGALNLLELLPRGGSSGGQSPSVRIDSFTVDSGRVLYADLSQSLHPQKTLAPIGFTLRDFQTDASAGGAFTLRATSERGEGFAWTGTLSAAPIASAGRLRVTGLQSDTVQKFVGEDLPVALTGGEASFAATYRFGYRQGTTRLDFAMPALSLSGVAFDGKPTLLRGAIRLDKAQGGIARFHFTRDEAGHMAIAAAMARAAMQGLSIRPAGAPASETIRLPALGLDDARFDYGARTVEMGRIAIDGAELPIRREKDGQISLVKLLPAAPATSDASTPGWTIRLGALSLNRAALHVEDRAVAPAVRFDIRPVELTATTLGSDLTRPTTLRFTARIDGKASVAGEGRLVPATATGDLHLRLAQLPLTAILPYAPRYPGLDPRSGTIGGAGTLHLAGKDMTALRFRGNAEIDDFAVDELATHSPLFAWKSFALTGVDYRTDRVAIDYGRIVQPLGRVEVLPDGSFNYAAVTAPAPVTAPDPHPAPTGGPTLPVRMKRLDVDGGMMSFADHSIDPNFAAQIDGLHGSLTDLSNAPGTASRITLDGHVVDRFSPVTIQGTMDLLGYDRRTDMHLAFRNIELPVFNPYSGRYAGYAIAKGKLTTELNYRIENRTLKAGHHIIIDQLQWGQATESKQKVPLPIRLATSLLKNKDGVIDLEVPVTGSLDDPQFRIAPIVWKIIGNVMEKAVTAPFRLIGSIFQGAEKAQYVDFAPGSDALPAGSTEAFHALAEALAQRPALELDIPAGPAGKDDALAVADARLDAALMAKEAKKGEATSPASLKPDERYDRLKALFKARLGRKPDAPAPANPPKDGEARKAAEADWMRSELRTTFLPSFAELTKLGATRAVAVRDALLSSGNIDPTRVFMATQAATSAVDGHSRLELKFK